MDAILKIRNTTCNFVLLSTRGAELPNQRLTISNEVENISAGIVKDKAAALMIYKGDAHNWDI